MAAYCTLEEAYNIPSFAQRRRKREAGPTARDDYPESRDAAVEGFSNNVGMRDKRTYRGQASDYDYYGKTYGLKFPKIATIEGFDAQGKCHAVSPQRYEIPVSKEVREEHTKTINASLDSPPASKTTKDSADGVEGYYDEELENYLSINEMRAAPARDVQPAPKVEEEVTPYDPAPLKAPVEVQRSDNWQALWDIVLFIVAGLLVIFLCEQLFKLAMLSGMRHTVQILEPYLSKSA